MHKTWRLQDFSETWLVSPRSSVSQEEQGAYLSAQIDRWLADPSSQQVLKEIYASLRGHTEAEGKVSQQNEAAQLLKTGLLDAFRRGEFVVYRMPHLSVFPAMTIPAHAATGAAVKEPPPKEKPPVATSDKTWVEIELVDQDGEPVPSVRFELELADGTKRTGSLDSDGRARLKDLDPGSFKVSFPDFDASEWDTA